MVENGFPQKGRLSALKSQLSGVADEVTKLTFRVAHSDGNSLASADASLRTAKLVAQVSNLPYRRLPVGRAS
jgi:hypothetical protein